MDEDEKQKLIGEIAILKQLDHPNILKLYEFFQDHKRYFLVTE
jgi:calcium-dependent protein kinase